MTYFNFRKAAVRLREVNLKDPAEKLHRKDVESSREKRPEKNSLKPPEIVFVYLSLSIKFFIFFFAQNPYVNIGQLANRSFLRFHRQEL